MIQRNREELNKLESVRAPSYNEALAKIVASLGKDFRVVQTRVVPREGLSRIIGGRDVEVYYAPCEHVGTREPRTTSKRRASEGDSSKSSDDIVTRLTEQISRLVEERQLRHLRRAAVKDVPGRAQRPNDYESGIASALHEHMATVGGTAAVADRQPSPVSPAPGAGTFERAKPGHPVVRAACQMMLEQRFPAATSSDFLAKLRGIDLPDELELTSGCARAARRALAALLRAHLPSCVPIELGPVARGERARTAKVVALVGPTGVGKTTTIAKLSAPLKRVQGRRVGIVTLDSYRIGACEQITRFGEIVGIPVTAVSVGEDLGAALNTFSDYDIVFVDTAGCSQRHTPAIERLEAQIRAAGDIEVHLCVPANAARDCMVEIAREFRTVGYKRLILTKVDECASFGPLLDLFDSARAPVSYLTVGQDVPKDVSAATRSDIEALLLGGRR